MCSYECEKIHWKSLAADRNKQKKESANLKVGQLNLLKLRSRKKNKMRKRV